MTKKKEELEGSYLAFLFRGFFSFFSLLPLLFYFLSVFFFSFLYLFIFILVIFFSFGSFLSSLLLFSCEPTPLIPSKRSTHSLFFRSFQFFCFFFSVLFFVLNLLFSSGANSFNTIATVV